jgi:hypothetical protein
VKQKDEVVDLGLVAPTTTDAAANQPKELDLFEQLTVGTEDDEAAVELSDAELGSLGEEYRVVAALKRKKTKLEKRVKEVSAEYEAARGRMQNAMKLQGTTQFKGTDDDGACSVGNRYSTKVEDPEAFISWVMSNCPELLTVNAQSRTKYIREEFKDKGVPADSDLFPPGIHAEEEPFLQVRGVRDTTPSKEQKAT